MRIAFFEDDKSGQFSPLALLRPVFELVCGHFSLRERVLRRFGVSDWGVFIRPHLADVYKEEHPEAAVNDRGWLERGTTLLINARWLPSLSALARIEANEAGVIDNELVYLTLPADDAMLFTSADLMLELDPIARTRNIVPADGRLLNYPWDLVAENGNQIVADFRMRQFPRSELDFGPQVAVLGSPEDVYVDARAQIDPFVVLDARTGPISIEAGAVVQPFTRIEGPCHVGRESQLFRTNVRGGTTIGPVCRAGGEIETSIMHAYANKYHDGFLGHAYVCPWVNLGALTTNSDLKNDYSEVRVPIAGEAIDTGSTKVGCFIGDHTKTALGSLFNTGSNIGVMSMVLPAGELLPKFVPSFSRIWHGVPDDDLDLDAAIETARTAMNRRNVELTTAYESLLRHVHAATQTERDVAIFRFREKMAARSAESDMTAAVR